MHHCIASLALAPFAALAIAQSPLTTTFVNNNGGAIGGAVYFDLDVTHAAGITITQIDLNGAPASGTLDILTIPGTRTGNQTNVAAWTGPSSLGNAITTLGAGVPSPCVLAVPLTLPFGAHGMALRANGFAHSYTNGTGTNQNFSTSELALAAGEATNIAFGGAVFTSRVVNCSIHYTIGGGSGTVQATSTPYGTGCITQFGSFYENFAVPHDLGSSALTMFHTVNGNIVLPGFRTFVAPSANATVLALSDDSETTVALSAAMPVVGGTTSNLTVCSNGYVSVASGNGTGFTPSVATLLAAPETGWWCWHDYNPAAVGSGQIKFEEVAGIAYVTWDGVFDFGSSGPGSTFQLQFHLATGSVHFVWGTMSGLGNGHLIGYSPAGGSLDPGNRDISATLPGTFFVGAADITPLQLDVATRPIVNTVINLTTSNLTPNTIFTAVALGTFTFPNPIDLTGPGMAGCFQYHDILATYLYLPSGASSVVTPFLVPNMLGLHIQAQSYSYDPAANLTLLGVVSSRAFDLGIGDF